MKACRAIVLCVVAWAGLSAQVPYWDTFRQVAGSRAPERAAQAFAESAFKARAVSYRVGSDGQKRPIAFGLTQFTPPTWIDYGKGKDPLDPVASIEAQHRYMLVLERMFQDFEQALGAYNCGPGNMRRAVRLAESLGLPGRSAWTRTLPRVTGEHSKETLAYVPKIVRKAADYRRFL